MVDDGIYGVDYVVDERLKMGLAGTTRAAKRVKVHQRCVLKVLGEQRVSLSIWVRHVSGNGNVLLSATWETCLFTTEALQAASEK